MSRYGVFIDGGYFKKILQAERKSRPQMTQALTDGKSEYRPDGSWICDYLCNLSISVFIGELSPAASSPRRHRLALRAARRYASFLRLDWGSREGRASWYWR